MKKRLQVIVIGIALKVREPNTIDYWLEYYNTYYILKTLDKVIADSAIMTRFSTKKGVWVCFSNIFLKMLWVVMMIHF